MLGERPPESSSLLWPLTGRVDELRRIADARAHGEPGVVVRAAAGVGKSRLAREALVASEAAGASTGWVQATRSAASVPLGAFALLLPDVAPRNDPLEIMQSVVASLRERADGRPIVLGVDDAQLLDLTSAALVLHLAVTRTAFLITTVRSDEPAPDAVVSLWKDTGAGRLELGPLGPDDTGRLVEAALDGPLEQRLHQWAYDASGGNVLYIRELVTGGLETGAIARQDGLWRLLGHPAPSRSLREIIEQRLQGLSDDELRAIEVLAVGEPLRLAEAASLVGYEPLSSVEARGLVTVLAPTAGDDVRLAHPLYGEVVRASMPVIRAREIRMRLASVLLERGTVSRPDALRIARFSLDAGEQVPRELLVSAAHAATVGGDADLGEQLSKRAIESGAEFGGLLMLTRAYVARRQFAEAAEALAAAEPHVTTQTEAADLFEYSIIALHWGLARHDDLAALLQRAEGWFDDEGWEQRLAPLRRIVRAAGNPFGMSVEDSAAALAQPGLGPDERRQLAPVHAGNLFYAGRVAEAHEQIWSIEPKLPIETQSAALTLALRMAIDHEGGVAWDELDAFMTVTVAQAIRRNDVGSAGICAAALGCLRFSEGRYTDAERWLAEAAANLSRDTLGVRTRVAAFQTGVACMRGDAAGAAAAAVRCDAQRGDRDPLPGEVPFLLLAQSWAARADGDRAGAARILLDGARTLTGMAPYRALVAYEALAAGAPPSGPAEVLAEVAATCDAPLVAAYVDHVAGVAAGDGDRILAAVDAFDAIGARRHATRAAADAARAHLTAGRTDSARRAAHRSHDLHEPDQGAEPIAIEGLDAPSDALTQRESQLVELAKRGLSNAEIADRLVLSVRTVESHMYRAMRKLGVTDRHDL